MKDTLISPVHLGGAPHLLLGRIGVHDAILPCNLVAIPLPKVPLLVQVRLQLLLEVSVQMLPLFLLGVGAARAPRRSLDVVLERAQLAADAVDPSLRRRGAVVEPALRSRVVVGPGQRRLLQLAGPVHIRHQIPQFVAHLADARQEVLLTEEGGGSRLLVLLGVVL